MEHTRRGDADPYATVASGRVPVRSTEHLLARMTATLEAHAATAGPDTLVLGTFRHVDHFCASTRSRWSGMAGGVAHAGAYAVGMKAGVESSVVHTPSTRRTRWPRSGTSWSSGPTSRACSPR